MFASLPVALFYIGAKHVANGMNPIRLAIIPMRMLFMGLVPLRTLMISLSLGQLYLLSPLIVPILLLISGELLEVLLVLTIFSRASR